MKKSKSNTFFYNPTELKRTNTRPNTADSKTSVSTYALLKMNKDFEENQSHKSVKSVTSVKSHKSLNSAYSVKSSNSRNLNTQMQRSKSFIALKKEQTQEQKAIMDKYKKSPYYKTQEYLQHVETVRQQKENLKNYGYLEVNENYIPMDLGMRESRVEFDDQIETNDIDFEITKNEDFDIDLKNKNMPQNQDNDQNRPKDVDDYHQEDGLVEEITKNTQNKKDQSIQNTFYTPQYNMKQSKSSLLNTKDIGETVKFATTSRTCGSSFSGEKRARGFNSYYGLKSVNNLHYPNMYKPYPVSGTKADKDYMIGKLKKKLFGKVQSVLPISTNILVKNYPNYFQDWIKYGEHY